MTRPKRAILTMVAGLLVAGGGRALAQSLPAEAPDTVIDVRIEGNKVLPEQAILAIIKIRPGQAYSDQLVREDEQRLLKTRRFDNVVATRTQTDKGVLVVFAVTERPTVEAVRIVGNKAFKTGELQKLIAFGPRDPIDRAQIESARRALATHYQSGGYHFAEVTTDELLLRDKREVVYTIVEGPKSTIRKIGFEGNRALDYWRLKGNVDSQARFWPFIPGTLDTELVDRDVVELRLFYRREGFLDAQVGRRLDFSADKRDVTLVFTIDEGPRYRIRQVLFDGNRVFSAEELRRDLKLTGGATFNGLSLRRDLDAIRDRYGKIGFIATDVNVKTRYATPTTAPEPAPARAPAEVDLLYTIAESEQFRVGQVEIRGNRITQDRVIRRRLQFWPGQVYDTLAVEESRKRLEETRLFVIEKVSITPFGDEPGVRGALVEVEEARTGSFLIGAGVSSNVGLLGNISYSERNFDLFNWSTFRGGGQVFSISAEPGLEFSRARIDWQEPYLMDLPFSLGLGAYAYTSQRETYDETRYGGYGSFGHLFPNRWYGEVAARVEGVDISGLSRKAPQDVRDVQGMNFLTAVKGTLVRDNTDSRWLPSRGDSLSVSYEQAVGDSVFGKAVGEYHIYHTLHQDALDRKHILAGRAMIGDIIGDAPVFERFYGGGSGSLRGLKYRTVGPKQGPFHEPVGGDFMVFLGGEYTYPIIGKNLRGVVFVDTGTVEPTAGLSDYRASVGFGLRLHLPFFGPVPMSLDFGFPVRKGDRDKTQVVSFNFGLVF